MKPNDPFRPGQLCRASSRTRTARAPLAGIFARHVDATVPATQLYAGPPEASRGPGPLASEWFAPAFPDASSAVQVRGLFGERQDASVLLLLDLGVNRDVSRIEMYGNLLLPPVEENGRPVYNFGLPRGVAVAVSEDPGFEVDLHGLRQLDWWHGELRDVLHPRYATRDLRALWGWTPIQLPPTFGRFLLFVFDDLPLVWASRAPAPEVGLDVERIVIYPFLEDVDHRPHVEYAPVASRQSAYSAPSAYWTRLGVVAPDPAMHQSIAYVASDEALMLPASLVGLGAISPLQGPVTAYASDLVRLDASERVFLTVQATSDEIPVADALRLTFRPWLDAKTGYLGPKAPALPDYLVSVFATNDVEAAWSAHPDHPTWRPVASEQLVRASIEAFAVVRFVEPVWARWFQLRVRAKTPEGIDLGDYGRFLLAGLDVLRCRDFWLAPDADEDVQVDSVLLRLRGSRLLDDYAYFDGQHGVGLTLESREADGPFEEIRSFRSLVELVENAHHRVFANYRRIDKPVQRVHEVTDSRTRSKSESNGETTADSRTLVKPEFDNTVVTRAGALTTHTDVPRQNLGGAPFTSLPQAASPGVTTTRTFEGDFAALAPPNLDLTSLDDVPQALQVLRDWAQQVGAQGAPVSLGLGLNFGLNLGAALGIQGGATGGVSGNAGVQVGGGVTKSRVTGSQGSVVESEARTLSSYTRQDNTTRTRGLSSFEGTAHDERDVVRYDRSEEARRGGVEVRYGGEYEDLILVSLPVGRMLRGSEAYRRSEPPGRMISRMDSPPRRAPDAIRVRVDHLPPGVRLDVEYRGRVLPHRDDED
jgi:hypothetical protein